MHGWELVEESCWAQEEAERKQRTRMQQHAEPRPDRHHPARCVLRTSEVWLRARGCGLDCVLLKTVGTSSRASWHSTLESVGFQGLAS